MWTKIHDIYKLLTAISQTILFCPVTIHEIYMYICMCVYIYIHTTHTMFYVTISDLCHTPCHYDLEILFVEKTAVFLCAVSTTLCS